MAKNAESTGSHYAIIAVIASIGLSLLTVFLISRTTNPKVVSSFIKLLQQIPIPTLTGIISLFVSAHYFGKKAGTQLEKDSRLGSAIGLTTALQVLTAVSCSLSLAVILQIAWNNSLEFWLAIFLLLRILIPLFILGLPFAFLIGYSFGKLLKKKIVQLSRYRQVC